MKEGRELVSEKKRESTDVICLILFIFFTIIILIAGIYSYIQGSTSKFSAPYDSDGRGCGVDYPQYSYIYFPSPQVDSLWVTTCVKSCPGELDKTVECQPNSVVKSCLQNNSADNTEAFHIYETETFRGSICLPAAQTIKDRVLGAIGAHFLDEMFGSVIKDWSLFLLVIPIAVLASIVALILIRIIAGYVIYLFYAFIIIALIIFGIYLVLPIDNRNSQTFVLKQNEAVSVGISVVCFILAITMLFLFISYKDKINLTVDYIDKSNEFFRENYSIILLPLVLTGAAIGFLYFWLFLTLSFYSLAEPVAQLNQFPYQHYNLPPLVVTILVISIFYLVWALFFLMHTGRCILSGTLISWRFDRNNPYLNASKAYFASHIGSACLSSFLTSVFGLFKFEVDDADCGESSEESGSKCIGCLSRCFSCFCCCCVNFIFNCFHHAGFAYLNLSGLPYCQSSTEVHLLVKEEKVTWSVVALLYGIFNELIPLIFAGANMVFANSLVNSVQSYHNKTSNRVLLLAIVGLMTYAVSQFFLSIYSQTVQSSFVLEQFHKRMPNRIKYPLKLRQQGLSELKPEQQASARVSFVPSERLSNK